VFTKFKSGSLLTKEDLVALMNRIKLTANVGNGNNMKELTRVEATEIPTMMILSVTRKNDVRDEIREDMSCMYDEIPLQTEEVSLQLAI
jgi:hypothetical protein